MAASSTVLSSSFLLQGSTLADKSQNHKLLLVQNRKKRVSFRVQAAKPPDAPFLGFKKTAEIWNSRACMIGIIGVFIVEFILNEGILQVIGVEVGKGLDLPL